MVELKKYRPEVLGDYLVLATSHYFRIEIGEVGLGWGLGGMCCTENILSELFHCSWKKIINGAKV